MRVKPKGRKCRNLFARRGVIYYESLRDGRRIKLSTKTDDWTEAAAFRDLYESRMGSSLAFKGADEVPRFGEFSERVSARGDGAPLSHDQARS